MRQINDPQQACRTSHVPITAAHPARPHGSLHKPLALALAAALGLAPLAASAATISVASAGDTSAAATNTCTLRQAIVSMNTGAVAGTGCNASGTFGSNDTITFATSIFPADGSGSITLTDAATSQLEVTATDLTIDATANSQVTIQRAASASNNFRILHDSAAAGASLTLSHLTLQNGKVTANDCNGWPQGGGICIPDANLTLTDSTVSGSTVNNYSGGWGGGIYADSGSVTLTHSTVSGNSAASNGGGIYVNVGSVTLTNSTVSGNSSEWGGGIAVNGGSITLTNSTVSGNSASYGGGIYSFGGSVTANNAILSGNTQGSGDDISGATASGSYNLIDSVANLNLGPLADNGGPTLTMAPQAGSAAIDAGACHDPNAAQPDGIPTSDQRGVARPQGTACDIGAVEVATVGDIIAANGSGQTTTLWQGFFNPLMVQVVKPSNGAARGVRLHAVPAAAGQAGAICSDAVTNGTGFAYLYCRANGITGSYNVQVSAVGWPAVQPVVFALTNDAGDGDTIFLDGFDPPGPRAFVMAEVGDGDFAIAVPGNLPEDLVMPLDVVTDRQHQPLVRVDALRRGNVVMLRVTRYADHGRRALPGAWQAASASPTLHLRRTNQSARALLQ